MSQRHRLNLEDRQCYFITVVTHKRKPIFRDDEVRKLWIKTLSYCHKKLKFSLLGYSLLLDHYYFIIIPPRGKKIEDIMHHINGVFANSYNKLTGDEGQVLQRKFWDHGIRNSRDFEEKLNYIHTNPVKHNLVKEIEDWPYSSWHNYNCDHKSIIFIDHIDI